jgi:ATP-dependent RNA helicase DeaD
MPTFKELGLRHELVQALDKLGFTTPTPIQERAIPQVLGGKDDLIALAQTGTGKTAAFSLPVLHQLDTSSNKVQCIVLCPTRELCLQIAKDMENFSTFMTLKTVAVYGGASMDTQIRGLRNGAQIVIGTPGRTVDLINRGALKLHDVEFLVLDEADEMLNMGFKEDLDLILNETPADKQTLLFSATMPAEIRAISAKYMKNPVEVKVKADSTGAANIEHVYYMVNARDKYEVLKRVADLNPDVYGIVFCRTRRETQEIANKLMADGYNADALHGDLSQAQRDTIMGRFRTRHLQMLVATDVAARGLDVNDLTHVINYSLPDEAEIYIHRSGRTGRAGKNGISIAIIHSREANKLGQIERKLGKKFVQQPVPTGQEICEKKLFTIVDRIHNVKVELKQIERFLPNVYEQLGELTREELIQKLVMHEFSTFLNYYKNAPDLNRGTGDKRERIDRSDMDPRSRERAERGNVRGSGAPLTKFRINVGRRDNVNPSTLIGFINDNLNRRDVEIGKIEVLNTLSFFEIEKSYAEALKTAMKEAHRGGRPVEVTEVTGAGPSERPSERFRPNPRENSFGDGSGAPKRNADKFQKRFESAKPAGKAAPKGKPFASKFKGKPKRD